MIKKTEIAIPHGPTLNCLEGENICPTEKLFTADCYEQDLLVDSYDYDLPPELIAARPIDGERDQCRLLVYIEETDQIIHTIFNKLPNFLPAQSLLVANQSKVVPARLQGHKKSGATVQLLLTSLIPCSSEPEKSEASNLSIKKLSNEKLPLYPIFRTLIKSNRPKRIGEKIVFEEGAFEAVIENIFADGSFGVSFKLDGQEYLKESQLLLLLKKFGQVPIPPYIRDGTSDKKDQEDYQTVYANNYQEGSVAAPTAGLHFTTDLISDLKNNHKVEFANITLHVSAGTFAPVKVNNILEHKMHSEHFMIDEQNVQKISKSIAVDRPIIAIGTTSLRVLESSFDKNGHPLIAPNHLHSTDIFIHPGKEVHTIRGLITNFHWPKSTLLMLISSLIGRKKTLSLYQEAIKHRYRFFSYGDAMLIIRRSPR